MLTALLEPITGKPAAAFNIQTDNSTGIATSIDFAPANSSEINAAKDGLLIPAVSSSAFIKTEKAINRAIEKTENTSRAARREAMRDAGIPTSQQPKSQSKNNSGREYSYDVAKKGGGTETKSVQ